MAGDFNTKARVMRHHTEGTGMSSDMENELTPKINLKLISNASD